MNSSIQGKVPSSGDCGPWISITTSAPFASFGQTSGSGSRVHAASRTRASTTRTAAIVAQFGACYLLEVRELLAIASRMQTLEDVLRWTSDVVDIVVQDEYTHDVIVRAREGFVVFDTT